MSVETFIQSLVWSPDATEDEKALVIGNLREYGEAADARVRELEAEARIQAEKAKAENERLRAVVEALRRNEWCYISDHPGIGEKRCPECIDYEPSHFEYCVVGKALAALKGGNDE